MITICICAQKGGVSKTTTAEALILGLRKRGYKVLGMDLDQQGNLTGYFNPNATQTVFDLVYGGGNKKPSDVIANDLIAGGLGLMYLPQFCDTHALNSLGNAIKSEKLDYDFMVIDTPPAINKVVMSALAMSDYVIMPTEPTKDSLDGILKTIQACDAIKEETNPELKILGILLVKYKQRYTLHRQFRDALGHDPKFSLFDTVIRESQAINNAKTGNFDFYSAEFKRANAVKDYDALVNEVVKKLKLK